MFQERYNRIVLPFIFLLDLLFLFYIYYLYYSRLQFSQLLLITFLWTIPSFYFNSYRIPRTYSTITALRPMVYTVFTFTFFYIFFYQLGFLVHSYLTVRSILFFLFLYFSQLTVCHDTCFSINIA